MDRDGAAAWVAGYERAWRQPGTDHLAALFATDVSYLTSPWREPVCGLDALAGFWDAEREGPDEEFEMTSTVLACENDTAVVRVAVDYGNGARWRDLWVIVFDADDRCITFEEWPFAPPRPRGIAWS